MQNQNNGSSPPTPFPENIIYREISSNIVPYIRPEFVAKRTFDSYSISSVYEIEDDAIHDISPKEAKKTKNSIDGGNKTFSKKSGSRRETHFIYKNLGIVFFLVGQSCEE